MRERKSARSSRNVGDTIRACTPVRRIARRMPSQSARVSVSGHPPTSSTIATWGSGAVAAVVAAPVTHAAATAIPAAARPSRMRERRIE